MIGANAGGDASAALPASADASDEELMRSWQRGDAAAFDTLYRRYRGTLYRFLVRQAGSIERGEELYHDVWMTLVRTRDGWTPRASLKTWLYHIAHSRLVDHYRSRSRRERPLDVSIDGEDAPEIADACPIRQADAAASAHEAGEALRRCLEALPPSQREAFLLKEESDLDLDQIAAVTGAGAETVKSRVRYAIDRLRRCLEGWL
jgi:RNA polymerase sigma factor (sigma-70 family)